MFGLISRCFGNMWQYPSDGSAFIKLFRFVRSCCNVCRSHGRANVRLSVVFFSDRSGNSSVRRRLCSVPRNTVTNFKSHLPWNRTCADLFVCIRFVQLPVSWQLQSESLRLDTFIPRPELTSQYLPYLERH